MTDPISEAFRRVIQEIYWVDDLEEAEEILTRYLEMIDDDLREVLLEKRRAICSDPTAVIELAKIDAVAQTTDDSTTSKILVAKAMIDSGFLLQCTKGWAKLDPRTKASILAPLYRASYGLELALRNWPKSIDEVQLDHAFRMATIALERAEELGLIDEFNKYLDEMLERLGVKE